MKYICYNINRPRNVGTMNHPKFEDCLIGKRACYTEENLAIVLQEAHNGEYTIEDDGVEEVIELTAQDDTDAMLIDHEYRLTLLELFTDLTV